MFLILTERYFILDLLVPGNRIVPNDPSTILRPSHSHPWTVGLLKERHSRIGCGGTLIASSFQDKCNHVITAAHCLLWCNLWYCQGTVPDYVVVGEHDQTNPNDGQKFIKVKDHYIRKGYEYGDFANDIAILVLEDSVNSEYAHCVMLPSNDKLPLSVQVDGWGKMGTHEPDSDVLRSVQLDVLEGKDIIKYECFSFGYTEDFNICGENLEDPQQGTCGGDSGGML